MKPDISLDQLPGVTAGLLDDLLAGHEELVETYLQTGARPGAEAARGGGKVLGVGLTEHHVNGQPTGKPAVLMLVDRLTRGGRGFPVLTSRGAPIVIEQAGEIRPLYGYRDRYRPVQAGTSIAPSSRAYSGALGCVVSCNGVSYLLSNNHVLADVNTIGPGTRITQPSIQDGASDPADVIGTLAYAVPIVVNGVSAADAAIARIAAGVEVDPRILRDDGVLEGMTAPVRGPVLGMAVQKSGRTTGHTHGKVTSIWITVTVDFAPGASTFNNMFSVRRPSGWFAQAGDSGAVITTAPSNQPLGLIVASDGNHTTYANTMPDVLDALAVQTGAAVSVVY